MEGVRLGATRIGSRGLVHVTRGVGTPWHLTCWQTSMCVAMSMEGKDSPHSAHAADLGSVWSERTLEARSSVGGPSSSSRGACERAKPNARANPDPGKGHGYNTGQHKRSNVRQQRPFWLPQHTPITISVPGLPGRARMLISSWPAAGPRTPAAQVQGSSVEEARSSGGADGIVLRSSWSRGGAEAGGGSADTSGSVGLGSVAGGAVAVGLVTAAGGSACAGGAAGGSETVPVGAEDLGDSAGVSVALDGCWSTDRACAVRWGAAGLGGRLGQRSSWSTKLLVVTDLPHMEHGVQRGAAGCGTARRPALVLLLVTLSCEGAVGAGFSTAEPAVGSRAAFKQSEPIRNATRMQAVLSSSATRARPSKPEMPPKHRSLPRAGTWRRCTGRNAPG